MKSFTTYLSTLALLLFLGMGASVVTVLTAPDALAQAEPSGTAENTDIRQGAPGGKDVFFVARNGDDDTGNQCKDATDPCDLETALDRAKDKSGGTLCVEIRDKGDTSVLRGDLDIKSKNGIQFGVFTRDDATKDMEECDDVDGTVELEGDITMEADLGARKWTTLLISSDNIEVGAPAYTSKGGLKTDAVLFSGQITLDGGSSQLLTVECSDSKDYHTQFRDTLTVGGDLEIECENGDSQAGRRHSIVVGGNLMVKGDIQLDDDINLDLSVDAAAKNADDPRVTINGDIEGDGIFMIKPEREFRGLSKDSTDAFLTQKEIEDTEKVDFVKGDEWPLTGTPIGLIADTLACNLTDLKLFSTHPCKKAKAVVGDVKGVEYRRFMTEGGFENDSRGCLKITGSGSLEMDIEKSIWGGACISLREIGAGGTSENVAGFLSFTGYGQTVTGQFRIETKTRTEFKGITITEDLEILDGEPGYLTPLNKVNLREEGDGGEEGDIVGPGSEDGGVPGHEACDKTSAYTPSRRFGVHFNGTGTVKGELFVTATGGECDEKTNDGVWIRGSLTVEDRFDIEGGTDDKGDPDPSHVRITSSGSLRAQDRFESIGSEFMFSGPVRVNGLFDATESDFHMDGFATLTLEDDLVVDGSSFKLANPAKMTIGYCSGAGRSGSNRFIFAGNKQEVVNHGDGLLKLGSIEVNGGEVILKDSVSVDSFVNLRRGRFMTNGLLGMAKGGSLALHASASGVGELDRGSGSTPYSNKGPTHLAYTTSKTLYSGDELYDGLSVENLLIDGAAGKSVEFQLEEDKVTVSRNLVLLSGMLKVSGGNLSIGSVTVYYGKGELETSAATKLTGSTVNFTYSDFRSDTGNLWTLAESKSSFSPTINNVTVYGCSTKFPIIGLREAKSRVKGHIRLTQGALNLAGNTLTMTGYIKDLKIDKDSRLCDTSAGLSCTKKADEGACTDEWNLDEAFAEVRYNDSWDAREKYRAARQAFEASRGGQPVPQGTENYGWLVLKGFGIWVLVPSDKDRLCVGLPHTKVTGSAVFHAGDTRSDTEGNVPEDMIDGIGVFSLINEGVAELASSVEKFYVQGDFTNTDGGQFEMTERPTEAGTDSIDTDGDGVLDTPIDVWAEEAQDLTVGGDLVHNDGAGFYAQGNDVNVRGNHMQVMDSIGVADIGTHGEFNLGDGMEHVMGDFMVGMHDDPDDIDSLNIYSFGDEHNFSPGADKCAGKGTGLFLDGNYRFAGSGDVHDDDKYTEAEQGIRGMVTFMGTEMQEVYHGSDGSQKFCNVMVDGDGGLKLMSDAVQHEMGKLTLKNGIIHSGDDEHRWTMYNSGIETDLVGRITAPAGKGIIEMGSRNSYIDGGVERVVNVGNAGGGVVTGGYLFPVGSPPVDGEERAVHHFRPLILQFPDDLGSTGMAGVDYLADTDGDDVDFPSAGIVVDAVGGGTMTLDNLGDQFWKVTFDEIPAHDPNLRLAAEGLPNVFEVTGLRIMQWDCDMENPRLAGTYDLSEDPTDDESMAVNDYINGVLNLTQEGVPVKECNVFGIASNFLENPISLPPIQGGIAHVQFIHNVVDAEVDVYLDGIEYISDWTFRSATGFVPIPGGEHTIDVVQADAEDNSNPVLSHTVQLTHEKTYTMIAHGDLTGAEIVIVDGTRQEAEQDDVVEFFIVHGAKDLGSVDIRLLDPTNNTDVIELLANNLEFTDVGTYLSLEPGGYNVEVTTSNNDRQIAVWRMELQQYRNEALVLNLSGPGKDGSEGVGVMGVRANGGTFLMDEITATEAEEELPEEFALKGNYPNPFNPSTQIAFDLPETAKVSLQIIDMLGRTVMTLPQKELEAGANRTVEVNAARLASGAYLYRIIAISASETNVETGRMMLIK